MDCIGLLTVGQSPRDDLVPFMIPYFGKPVRVLQGGALDGLSPQEIAGLGPNPGEVGIVARLRDGSNTLLSHAKILPRGQAVVDRAQDDGAEMLVIMCGADWSAIRSKVLVVNPGKVFPAIISAVAGNRNLGVIKPSAGQLEQAKRQFADRGVRASHVQRHVVQGRCPFVSDQVVRPVRLHVHAGSGNARDPRFIPRPRATDRTVPAPVDK